MTLSDLHDHSLTVSLFECDFSYNCELVMKLHILTNAVAQGIGVSKISVINAHIASVELIRFQLTHSLARYH